MGQVMNSNFRQNLKYVFGRLTTSRLFDLISSLLLVRHVKDRFTDERSRILLHGHCHQKALTDINKVVQLLSIPKNFGVELIPSGCCGMAGSFGYEKEHYAISQAIGELVLFPRIRESQGEIIAASGTSCRHQIFDGTGKASYHPIEALLNTLKK